MVNGGYTDSKLEGFFPQRIIFFLIKRRGTNKVYILAGSFSF